MSLTFQYLNLRSSEIHLFCNLGDFYWHFLEILWLFIFLFLYSLSLFILGLLVSLSSYQSNPRWHMKEKETTREKKERHKDWLCLDIQERDVTARHKPLIVFFSHGGCLSLPFSSFIIFSLDMETNDDEKRERRGEWIKRTKQRYDLALSRLSFSSSSIFTFFWRLLVRSRFHLFYT